MSYLAANNTFSVGASCGNPIARLSGPEFLPIATSLIHVLTTTPNANGITSLTEPIIKSLHQNKPKRIEDMLTAGMTAAAQGVYLAGFPIIQSNEAVTAGDMGGSDNEQTSISLVFTGYVWGRGWKGIAWMTALFVISTFTTIMTVFSLVAKRLRYDPGDFAQTVFVALGSRLDPPDNTCTGNIPNKLNNKALRYGPAWGSRRLQFSHDPNQKPDKLDQTLLYANQE
jgi:hypothetical protein